MVCPLPQGSFVVGDGFLPWRVTTIKNKTIGRPHRGIDLPAPKGTPVSSFADGVVERVGKIGDYGNAVYIRHSDGTQSRYGHLSAFADIQPGMEIKAGQILGNVGSTGRSSGNHLHFELRDKNGNAFNPRWFVDQKGTPPVNKCDVAMLSNENLSLEEKKNRQLAIAANDPDKIVVDFEKKTEAPKRSLFGRILGFLVPPIGLAMLVKGDGQKTEEASAVLSKKELMAAGFTKDEVSKISQLAQKPMGLSARLAQAGQKIDAKSLESIGLDQSKIELFDRMCQQKNQMMA